MNQDQLNKIRMAAGLAPRYDRAEREHLAESNKKPAEKTELTEAANNRAPSNVLREIARRHLNIRSLDAQNNDDKDFHEVSVWAVEAALKAAFKAGQDSAKKMRRTVKEGDESKEEAKKGGSDYDPKGGERYPAKDECDPDEKETVAPMKQGKSADSYKTPKNKTAKEVTEGKKAKKDYDGDGKVETEEEEHRGVVDKAIKKAKKEKMEEGKKAKKDYDGDGKVESEEAEHRGVVDKAIKKAKKEKMNEMDLELDMGDEGPDAMKQRRLDLIRKAAEKVRGGEGDIVDVGEPDDEGDLSDLEEPRGEDEYNHGDEGELTGEMGFGGESDFDFGEEDCEYAMSVFQPEDEEAYASGFDAFRRGEPAPEPETHGSDFHNGYETARMTRMSAVAEGSSEGYTNPKGKKLKADPKSGANAKLGCQQKDKPHKDNITGAKPGLKKIGEAAEDATVFDKDYHYPVGANGHWDMAQHKGEPHVQGRGQEEKVKVPADVKAALKEEIAKLYEDSGKVRHRDEYRSDFYENTAQVFEMLLAHLEEATKHSLMLAQIDMNRVMSPMIERIPRNVYMYIVRGGKPASLNELFREVKVKAETGADPSKEDYTK